MMRGGLLVVALLLAACRSSGLPTSTDLVGADLAGADLMSLDQSSSTVDASREDLSGPHMCFPGGTTCDQPNCGTACCASGEWCDNGTCHCGSGGACTDGNLCNLGPVIDGDGCGTVCCGKTGPCPG